MSSFFSDLSVFFKMNSDKKLPQTTVAFYGLEEFVGGEIGGSLYIITTKANFPYDKQGVLKIVLGISECVCYLYTIIFR